MSITRTTLKVTFPGPFPQLQYVALSPGNYVPYRWVKCFEDLRRKKLVRRFTLQEADNGRSAEIILVLPDVPVHALAASMQAVRLFLELRGISWQEPMWLGHVQHGQLCLDAPPLLRHRQSRSPLCVTRQNYTDVSQLTLCGQEFVHKLLWDGQSTVSAVEFHADGITDPWQPQICFQGESKQILAQVNSTLRATTGVGVRCV